MTAFQKSMLYSWITLGVFFSLTMIFFEIEYSYVWIGLITIPIYAYFRGDLDKGVRTLEFMTPFWQKFTAGYYMLFAVIVIIQAIKNPSEHFYDYGNRLDFVKFFLLVAAPVIIVVVRREIILFRSNGRQET